ncbi:ATP-binding cassette sub-family G member 1-like isoform X3 [Rhodnius prolixus]|uniref:ATP-binding cassette sub-family G member 1-like isoform X3 n=3 Tax=Rhodnius prolixus TaxID=13249 RepID=UPI003D18EB87
MVALPEDRRRNFRQVRSRRRIIKGISGQFRSGQITAIMGPSGAGKSTLMNILVGYVTAGVGGCIKVNGEPRKLSVFNKLSSYIMQEDLLQPFLTVRECLNAAAQLKLGADCPDKNKAVEEILATLGLTSCADNFTDKISGGQRKRVSVALELVSNPTVVFLDEPTTGLDVVSINQTVKLLKMLARQGRTVICTIHQPSASLFDLFDRIYILARGKCIYQGEPNQLVPYLSDSIGAECPHTYNPADFILEILQADVIVNLCESIENGKLIKTCREDDVTSIVSYDKSLYNKSHLKGLQFPNSFWTQFCILFRRMMLQKRRHVGGLWLQIIHHIFSGVLIGLIFLNVGNDANRPFDNFKFMLCVSVFFMYTHCMTPVLTYPADIKLMKREFFNRWYSLKAYYLAKSFSSIPLIVILGFIFIVIVYVMSDQPREFRRFSWFTLNCILIGLTSEGLGILIGFTFKNTNGTVVGPSTMAPILMLAMHGMGYGLHIEPFMAYVMKISYVRYAIVSIITALYLDNRVMTCQETTNEISYCHYADGRMLVRDLGMEGEETAPQLVGVLFYFIFFRFLAFLSLRYRCTTEFSNQLLIYLTKIIKRK